MPVMPCARYAETPKPDGTPIGIIASLILSQAEYYVSVNGDFKHPITPNKKGEMCLQFSMKHIIEDIPTLTKWQVRTAMTAIKDAGILRFLFAGSPPTYVIPIVDIIKFRDEGLSILTVKKPKRSEIQPLENLTFNSKESLPSTVKIPNPSTCASEKSPESPEESNTEKEEDSKNPPTLSEESTPQARIDLIFASEIIEDKPAKRVMQKPTLEQVAEYMTEIGVPHLAEQWLNYYQSNGWKVGRDTMKDWQAACRTWKFRENNRSPTVPIVSGSAANRSQQIQERFAKKGHILCK